MILVYLNVYRQLECSSLSNKQATNNHVKTNINLNLKYILSISSMERKSNQII